MIVDQHQPVVEKYYGAGKMASVLERLLQESDRVAKGLVENWVDERSMKRKVCRHIMMTRYLCSRRFSPKLIEIANTTFQALAAPAPPIRRAASTMSAVEEDLVDPREIDKVLTEVAGMAGRWSMFRKFLHERLKVRHTHSPLVATPHRMVIQEEYSDEDDDDQKTEAADLPPSASNAVAKNGDGEAVPEAVQAVESCATRQLMQDALDSYYTPLEIWYARTIIDKAGPAQSVLSHP